MPDKAMCTVRPATGRCGPGRWASGGARQYGEKNLKIPARVSSPTSLHPCAFFFRLCSVCVPGRARLAFYRDLHILESPAARSPQRKRGCAPQCSKPQSAALTSLSLPRGLRVCTCALWVGVRAVFESNFLVESRNFCGESSVSSASSSTHRPWAQLRGTACSVRLRGSGADLGLKAEALELRGDQAEALRRRRQGHRTRGRRSRSSRRVLLGRRVRRRWVGLQRRRRCRCKRHSGTPERGARRLAWLSALRRQPS